MKTFKIQSILILLGFIFSAFDVAALGLGHYATHSVLSQGNWVKVSVEESGLYSIPAVTLRKWGFQDPTKVRVYGYGGKRIADALTAENYVDDLPLLQTVTNTNGDLVFYAQGVHEWVDGKVTTRRSNPYSTKAYYYITDSDAAVRELGLVGVPGAENPETTFVERLQHELDLVSPGEGGQMLVGEDFRFTPSRTFKFSLPGAVGGATFQTSFVAKTVGASSKLTFAVNGDELPAVTSDIISASKASSEVYGNEGISVHSLDEVGEQLDVKISLSSTVTVQAAWLNYIAVNYARSLSLPSQGVLSFSSSASQLALLGAGTDVNVWDVTNPLQISKVDCESAANGLVWTANVGGKRSYVAWKATAALPQPQFEGAVANQDLHSHESAHMVIFTHQAWRSQAERLAELHRGAPDNLTVQVVNVADVYNEFSSGCQDVSALRKYLKMLYDRGAAAGKPLCFALLMGRMTYDERGLTSNGGSKQILTLPAWQQRDDSPSLDDEKGFATDDFLAMLEDETGSRLGADHLSVAVGRLPVTSLASAKTVVDKIVDYARRSTPGAWKNRVMALADDLDGGVHYKQTEWFMRGFGRNRNNPFVLEKIYLPAFEKSNGVYQSARDKMFRTLNDGVVWWTFVGHATNHSWTGDGMFTFSDINRLYLRHLPFVYAATCNFLRWDSNTQSGGEIMMYEQNGGVIGMISSTRPVYITYNGYFTNAIGQEVSRRDANGALLPLGEIYRRAKNNIRAIDDNGIEKDVVNNENRLRYVFMGDPALKLATPDKLVRLEEVDGKSVNGFDQIILQAHSMPVLKGSITDVDGNVVDGFNGTLLLDLYDADRSVTLTGDEYEKMLPFDEHGDKLYSGSCKVKDGHFELVVAMPSEISENFREATVSMFAYSDDGVSEASGLNRSCYVFGYDEDVADDTEPPVIHSLVLNHPTFTSGDEVNSSPMLLASVSDNVGINLSMAGIGKQMSVLLDDKRSLNDVPFYYTPSPDGTPSGTVAYPLENLTEGHHSIRFRVFDTNGNSATKTVECFVKDGLAPTIFDIYTDANPAETQANFYLSHNRPDGMLTVTVSVYNLLGHKLWSSSSTARSDMFISSPVTWDLTDGTGRRVPRGIYLYSATITADGESFSTATRKIAVTSR